MKGADHADVLKSAFRDVVAGGLAAGGWGICASAWCQRIHHRGVDGCFDRRTTADDSAMGAWLETIGQLLRPLARLPILIAMTVGLFYLTGTDVGLGGQVLGGGALLYWLKQGRGASVI